MQNVNTNSGQQMNLREIQASWNALVPVAIARGIEGVQIWAVPPQTRDRGMRRLNWLRAQLGIPVAASDTPVEHAPGAALPPIREIMTQYNMLVPEAQRRGFNVRAWSGIPSTALRGYQRLQKLRRQLGETVSVAAISVVVDGVAAFNAFTFGVELEAFMPSGMTQSDLAYHLTQAGVPTQVEHLNHQPRRDHWKIVTDGSLRNYQRGIELVSPILNGEEGFVALRKACKILVERKVKATVKCGFHVHLGWKDGGVAEWDVTTLRNVIKMYSHFEPGIDSVLTPSRRGPNAGEGYCRFVQFNPERLAAATTVDNICDAIGQARYSDVRMYPRNSRGPGRYRKVNLQSLGVYGTVEFRHHQGTVDADMAEYWVRFVMRMALAAKANNLPAMSPAERGFATLANVIGLDALEKRHFEQRVAKMARQEERARARSRVNNLTIGAYA